MYMDTYMGILTPDNIYLYTEHVDIIWIDFKEFKEVFYNYLVLRIIQQFS